MISNVKEKYYLSVAFTKVDYHFFFTSVDFLLVFSWFV